MVLRTTTLVLCGVWLVPTLGLLITSFRGRDEATTSGWWTVFASPLEITQWTLANYERVLFASGMGNAFLNTVVVTLPATVLPLTVAAVAAYGFSFTRFRGRSPLFVGLVALLVVPAHTAFIPLLRAFAQLEMTGTFTAAWLAHTAFGLPLAVYLLRNYMDGLPRELVESARVDGATHAQALWRVVLPLATPALAAFAVFQFLWVWNDFLVALVFLGGTRDVQVMTVNLTEMVGQHGQDWHLLTAGAFITLIVPMVVFFALQRYFVRGMTAGSVKG